MPVHHFALGHLDIAARTHTIFNSIYSAVLLVLFGFQNVLFVLVLVINLFFF